MRILTADHVIPVSSDAIEFGAVAIDGSTIAAVDTAAAITAAFPDAHVENFGAAAIIPGLVNCHSHLEITAMRGLLDDVEHDFTSWLLRLNDTRATKLSDEDIAFAAVAGALEGAAAGVTCFGDIGRNAAAGLEALRSAGLRGVVFQETNFSPDDRTAEDDFRALREKTNQLRSAASELVDVGISPHSPYTVGPKLFSLIAEHAAAEDLKVTVHAAESHDEDRLLRTGSGLFVGIYEKYNVRWSSPHCSTIEYLERTGILGTSPLLAHCVNVTDADIAVIKSHGATVAHCPKSNAKLGHGAAPLERLLDAGVNVGLGSDSVASNNRCDILEEARFAALIARNREGSERFIGAREILASATLGGARALGLDGKIGTLDAGKQADLAVISLKNVAQLPVNDIYAALIFASSGSDVVLTIVGGEEVYRNGRWKNFERSEMIDRLAVIRLKMKP